MKYSNKTMVYLLFWIFPLFNCCNGDNTTDASVTDVVMTLRIDEVIDATSASCTVQLSLCGLLNGELEKGVCYSSANATPSIKDEFATSDEKNADSFSLTLRNLKEQTTYYLRPYAKVGNDVFYGRVASLKTLGSSADYYSSPKDDTVPSYDGYKLVWADEFDIDGKPSKEWSYETGFVRNEELQWYQADNASVKDGCLLIEGRQETVYNPNYIANSTDWKTNRSFAAYTSSCLTTRDSHTFMYGRFEIRAKIPVTQGAWPAIWLLGNMWEWPMNGEIDILEYYLKNGVPSILANACWSSDKLWTAIWNESSTPFSHFLAKDENWAEKFHIWRMDWNEEFIRIYVDNELLNEIDLATTYNQGYGNNYENPFRTQQDGFGHYLLLNLAIGSNGGTPDDTAFPLRYRVDYVRVYEQTN